MLWFRNADTRFPFLHESSAQVPARWHGAGAGPAQYLADTADGAWAEFLRHEEISDPRDLAGISRNLWAVEVTFESETVSNVGINGGTSQPMMQASTSRGPKPPVASRLRIRTPYSSGSRSCSTPMR